jgi:quercetin dioxygenase-like cupin family protein
MSFDAQILLRGEETAGAIGLVENRVPAGWEGPPLHRHAFDEAFYVLDGELTFQLADELLTAPAGSFVFVPGDAIHTLANLSGAPVRYLLFCTPAGFERRFDASPSAGPVPETIVVGPPLAAGTDLDRATAVPAASAGINVHVRSEDSEGRVSLMENAVGPRGSGPPLHHHAFDELFYVLAGELTFELGGERVTRRAGEFAFAPRGAHHTFANLGDAPARMLLVCTPAGFERYFARMAAEHAGVDPPDWAMRPWQTVTKVGPPIPVPEP